MPKTTPREEAALKKLEANANQPRYVSCDLTVEQKQALDVFIDDTDAGDLLQWVASRILDNHVMSMKSLDIGFQCNLTGSKDHPSHGNSCLISRSSTPERALYSVMFKDTQVLKGTWPVINRLEDLD